MHARNEYIAPPPPDPAGLECLRSDVGTYDYIRDVFNLINSGATVNDSSWRERDSLYSCGDTNSMI